MTLAFLGWVDGGYFYEMRRIKDKEPHTQFWSCGKVGPEMETVPDVSCTMSGTQRVWRRAVMVLFR